MIIEGATVKTSWPHWQVRLRATSCCAVLLLLSGAGMALAQEYPPTSPQLTISTSEASPDDPVTVSGSGYEPGMDAAITVESTPVFLATVRADTTGRYTTVVRIPMDTALGEHTIKATNPGAGGRMRVLSARILIRERAGVAVPPGPRPGSSWLDALADRWPIIVATLAPLLGLGGSLMWVRRWWFFK